MKILLIGHHVQALVEVIGILPVDGGGQVPGSVQGSTIGAENDAGWHAVLGFLAVCVFFGEIHHRGTLGDGQQTLLLQFINHPIHLVIIEAFPGVAVEGNAQQLVHTLRIPQGQGLEPVPQAKGFFVPVLDLLEPGTAFVFQTLVLFCFLVEFHVQAHQLVNAALFHRFLAAPLLVGTDHLAELGAPVAQVIDAHGGVAQVVINAAQAVTDHGGGQMADVEPLGDVDGGIVQAHRLSLAQVGSTVLLPSGKNGLHGLFSKVHPVQEEVQVTVDCFYPSNILVLPVLCHGLGNHGRTHPQCLSQPENRQGIVPQGRIRRHGQQGTDFLRSQQTLGVRPCIMHRIRSQGGDFGHHIHIVQRSSLQ